MINQIVQIRFPTHFALVSQDDETLEMLCFKHDDGMCDFQSFTDCDELADYMLTPLPTIVYHVVTHD